MAEIKALNRRSPFRNLRSWCVSINFSGAVHQMPADFIRQGKRPASQSYPPPKRQALPHPASSHSPTSPQKAHTPSNLPATNRQDPHPSSLPNAVQQKPSAINADKAAEEKNSLAELPRAAERQQNDAANRREVNRKLLETSTAALNDAVQRLDGIGQLKARDSLSGLPQVLHKQYERGLDMRQSMIKVGFLLMMTLLMVRISDEQGSDDEVTSYSDEETSL